MTVYAIDKSNAKILGVCGGLARSTGWDPTLVRAGALALLLFVLGPLIVPFYLAVGVFGPRRIADLRPPRRR